MTNASDMLLSIFDRIYIINLAHRADRRNEMDAELRSIGLSLDHPAITLFPASFPAEPGEFPSRGARGCFESHLGVHRAILDDGVRHALVLEDDASFVPDFRSLLASLHSGLRDTDWDMFYSVSQLDARPGDQPVGPDLLRLSSDHTFQLTHFIGFSAGFSRLAVPYLERIQGRKGGDPEGGPMHVDGAYCWIRAAYPQLTVLGSRRPLAVQRSSRSDIAVLPIRDRLPVLRQLASFARRSPYLLALRSRLRRKRNE